MSDFTFSQAIAQLKKTGFISGYECEWQRNFESGSNPFAIFIHPRLNTVLRISGIGNDDIEIAQIYFTWKPNGEEELRNMFKHGRYIQHKYLHIFNGGTGKNNVFDGTEKKFDSSVVGFPFIQLKRFDEILETFELFKENGDFKNWQPDTNFSLLMPYESNNFRYGWPKTEELYSQPELKIALKVYISNERSKTGLILSKQRLGSILTKLEIPLEKYGLI
jgi:hypothetical protein